MSTIAMFWPTLRTGRLITLWTIMQRFEAAKFVKLAAELERLSALGSGIPDHPVDRDFVDLLLDLRQRFQTIGMRLTVKLLDRLCVSVREGGQDGRPMTIGQFSYALAELQMRVEDEMADQLFLQVASNRADYFEQDAPFGQAVSAAFPSLVFDAREAGTCLAVGRYTAAMMHLSRVLETALKALGRDLGVEGVEHLPSWDAILSKIDTEIARRHKDKSPGWAPREQFFAEAAAFLRSVQRAWRNPSMHADKTYTYEHALDVYKVVGAFLTHLAKEVREPAT